MIGRLLQSAASTFGQHGPQRAHTGLESVTEESHTRELLFPDPAALRASLSQGEAPLLASARPATAREAANFDDRGGLDISSPGDLRLIIAQDANARYHQPQVLYDSKPTRSGSSGGDSRGNSPLVEGGIQQQLSRGKSMTSPGATPKHRHTPSGGSFFSPSGLLPLSPLSPRSPDKPRSSGLGDMRTPRASPFDQAFPENETAQGKIVREAKEETDALLGCMFGAPGFRLEPGTKLHILPKKTTDAMGLSKSPSTTRPISSGGGFQRKRTPLVRSTSAADVSRGALAPTSTGSADGLNPASKPSILFTRLFTINVQDEVAQGADGSQANPESPLSPTQTTGKNGTQPKQKKVPMYAISVVLQLPSELPSRLRPSTSQQGLSSLASSLNDSSPASSWRADQGIFAGFMEVKSYGPIDSVLNSHLPQVLLHWNIISRALELLELTAKIKLGALLENMTPFTPLNPPPTPKPGPGKAKKPNKTTQQSVYVPAGCLQDDTAIKSMSEATSQRIVGGLRTRRVIVGQGRWGAWREEARWIARWAGGRDQNFFLFNVLTAFLGSHTEWLETLAPPWYRRKHRQQRKTSSIIRTRTVIVSSDKMASRRLIFLLASFLPSHLNHQLAVAGNVPTNQLPYSESPPAFASQREPGLRRSGTQKSSLGRSSGATHARSVSFSLTENNEEAVDDAVRSRARRDSDAKSLRSPSLVIPHAGGSESRKASMSTVTADAAQAVPHFSNLSYGEPVSPQTERQRPISGGSLASLALSHNLKRSESGNGSTAGSGRWGSMVSGFWSNRRDSSTDDSDVFVSSQDSPRKTQFPHHEHRHSAAGLERMVEEASTIGDARNGRQSGLLSGSPRRPLRLDECLKPRHPALSETSAAAKSIPRPQKPERMPLKLSFNEDEGYLDIAMDSKEQSFPSSLASSFASSRLPPLGSGFGAIPSTTTTNEHWSPYGSITSDVGPPHADPALDVAGWLKAFQPDFVLQAVAPYDGLRADVEAAARAEALADAEDAATPAPDDRSWRTVSETLVADTARFTIDRIRVRRRRRQASPTRRSRSSSTLSSASGPTTPTAARAGSATSALDDPRFEVRVAVEPVMDLDPTLIDAVERVLALSGSNSRATSPQRPGFGAGTTAAAAAAESAKNPAGGSAAGDASGDASPGDSDGATPTAATANPGLNGSASKLAGSSSRPASLSAAPRRHLRADDGAAAAAAAGLGADRPSAETRRAVLGALEDVVRAVIEDREREEAVRGGGGGGGGGGRNGGAKPARPKRGDSTRRRKEEGTLREGVRRWLGGVERAAEG